MYTVALILCVSAMSPADRLRTYDAAVSESERREESIVVRNVERSFSSHVQRETSLENLCVAVMMKVL